jgi:predicted DNA-binding transcriptional regulator YafY
MLVLMRRADRLFQIVQLLRRRRLTTAAQIAERLEVSERTIYRDVRDLSLAGVPVLGEAGVGYRLGRDFELPPMMFTVDEIQALVLGARMVESWGDEELRRAARDVLTKVESVLPPSKRHRVQDTALFSLSFRVSPEVRTNVGTLRKAIDERTKVHLDYADAHGTATGRVVCPLGLYFWGAVWTLGAWCELRGDFRNFRLDRIESASLLEEIFEYASPTTLDDFIKAMTADER